ncbi:hypothetical protein DPMN_083857 [Dreissena polymorpha]|uniref:Uncharacterized protein n=1 Tax=Dreissena polymorpha TaxID=45954 RepID=A0A9D3YDH9_DREPO|nr:hypothetical protein DPMN_083857 [Dreissena polymorpha]
MLQRRVLLHSHSALVYISPLRLLCLLRGFLLRPFVTHYGFKIPLDIFLPVTSDNLPSTSGFNYSCVDFADGHSSLPENYNLVQDNLTIIPNSVSTDCLHTAGVVDSEPDSDADIETDQYLASINQIYELISRLLAKSIVHDL